MCAHKKGEVVEPAGGETGERHCLAEVYQLPRSSFDSSANLKEQPIELLRKILSAKNERTVKNNRGNSCTPKLPRNDYVIVQLTAIKSKHKMAFFSFFLRTQCYRGIGRKGWQSRYLCLSDAPAPGQLTQRGRPGRICTTKRRKNLKICTLLIFVLEKKCARCYPELSLSMGWISWMVPFINVL